MMLNTLNVPNVDIDFRNKPYSEILSDMWQKHLAPREYNAPTVISLFAGCGGSSLGYSMAGYQELLAVEWDKNACQTFRINFPDVPIYEGDIYNLTVEQIKKITGLSEPGELDLLDGSPPCQGFSMAGKRKMTDPKNQLYQEYIRILRELKPKVFVMENVSGLVKGKMKVVFADIMRELKASGYFVKCQLMDTAYFGVPQHRRRLIWIGVRNDLGRNCTFPLPLTNIIPVRKALEQVEDKGKTLTPQADKYWPFLKYGESASKYHPKGHFFGLIKLNPDKPAPTLICSAGSSLVHWNQRRSIGNNERIRLTSFPDEFKWIGNTTDICNRVGNSVPPLFMYVIANHIKENILHEQ